MSYRVWFAVVFSLFMVTSVFATGVSANTETVERIKQETEISDGEPGVSDSNYQKLQEENSTHESQNQKAKTFATLPSTELINKTYDTGSNDGFRSMIRTSDGGYLLGGGAGDNGWLVKVDNDGNIEWQNTYNTGSSNIIVSIDETSNGYVFLGNADPDGDNVEDPWLGKVDSSGNLQWDKTYGGIIPESVITTSDGSILFVARKNDGISDDFYVVKTNSTGSVEFNKTYGDSGRESARSVIEISNGYVVAGEGDGAEVLKIDDSGNQIWMKEYTNGEYADSIIQTSDGGFVFAGLSYDGSSDDAWLVKLDSSGYREWGKNYGTSNRDNAFSVTQTSDSGFSFAGKVDVDITNSIPPDAWLVKTDSSGKKKWEKRYGESDNTDIGYSVVETGGNYTVAGSTYSYGSNPSNGFLVKYGVPKIDVSPGSVDYGDVKVGKSSTASVTVENQGTASLEVSDTSITGADTNEFSIVSGDAPYVINPGNSKQIKIKFGPDSRGTKTANLEIQSNDPEESLVKVGLKGTGTVPDISVTPLERNFVGNGTKTVYVENKGDGPLNVSSVAVVEGDASNFRVKTSNTFVVSSGDRKEVEVEFSASTEGEKQATLEIQSDDSDDSLVKVDLVGAITQTDLKLNPTQLSYRIPPGEIQEKSITLSNSGTGNLKISKVSIGGEDADAFSTNTNSLRLEPSKPENIEIKFSPHSTGRKRAKLYLETSETTNSAKTTSANISILLIGESEKNQEPTASFEYSPQKPSINQTVRFDARASNDDYSLRKIEWKINDGEFVNQGKITFHEFSKPGKHNVTLRVTDEFGKSSTVTKTVEVADKKIGKVVYSNLEVSSRKINVSEKLEVSAVVSNTGDFTKNYTAVLNVTGLDSEYYRTGILEPRSSKKIGFILRFRSSGEYNVSINDLGPVTVEVLGDEDEKENVSVVKAIANHESENDKISFDEVQTAISYWSSNEKVPGTDKTIDFEKLQEIISLWSSGEKI